MIRFTERHAMHETNYIKSVSPRRPGANFNHDPSCFARYAEMQAKQIEQDGWKFFANEIRRSMTINA
jgi:hypothetical protein